MDAQGPITDLFVSPGAEFLAGPPAFVADQRLGEVAPLFAEEMTLTGKCGPVRRIHARGALVPLVPEDLVSADGTTPVAPLCIDRELRAQGARMLNCLRSTSASSVARHGPLGTMFMVGIYDVHTGKALSTVEIRAVSAHRGKAYRLFIEQHTASANRTPSRRRPDTPQKFLRHCRSEEVRADLTEQWRILRHLSVTDYAPPAPSPRALSNTLGEQVYEGLLRSVRE